MEGEFICHLFGKITNLYFQALLHLNTQTSIYVFFGNNQFFYFLNRARTLYVIFDC